MATLLLEGNLGLISLPNLVQLIRMERKTGRLELSRVEINQHAVLYFNDGQLIYAAVNLLRGEEAMFRILAWWTAGTFKLTAEATHDLPAANLGRPVDWLLLEGMRKMDENGALRGHVPEITTALSYTDAGLAAFSWDRADPPEWIPHWLRTLPRTFSLAQVFEVCHLGETDTCQNLAVLLQTGALASHHQVDAQASAPLQRTRLDSFALVVMEFVGYEAAYRLVEGVCHELGMTDLESASFGQMVNLADRLSGNLTRQLGEELGNQAMKKLRARITSLL